MAVPLIIKLALLLWKLISLFVLHKEDKLAALNMFFFYPLHLFIHEPNVKLQNKSNQAFLGKIYDLIWFFIHISLDDLRNHDDQAHVNGLIDWQLYNTEWA